MKEPLSCFDGTDIIQLSLINNESEEWENWMVTSFFHNGEESVSKETSSLSFSLSSKL